MIMKKHIVSYLLCPSLIFVNDLAHSLISRCQGAAPSGRFSYSYRLWLFQTAGVVKTLLYKITPSTVLVIQLPKSPGSGFTKPCALLKLDFLTSAYEKCMRQSESPALVRRKGFVKPAPELHRYTASVIIHYKSIIHCAHHMHTSAPAAAMHCIIISINYDTLEQKKNTKNNSWSSTKSDKNAVEE